MHKTLIPLIIESNNKQNIHYLEQIMLDVIDELKLIDYDFYSRIENKLYKIVYGKHLNKELAYQWVSLMQNKDNTIGEHWSFDEALQYASNHNINDWYAVLNMMYSDYYNSKYTIDDYIKLANDFISDRDGKESKVLDYYLYVVCGK